MADPVPRLTEVLAIGQQYHAEKAGAGTVPSENEKMLRTVVEIGNGAQESPEKQYTSIVDDVWAICCCCCADCSGVL